MTNSINEKNEKTICCSFCDKSSLEVKTLIASTEKKTYICNECINTCLGLISDDTTNDTVNAVMDPMLLKTDENKPKMIFDKLNQYIIGQDKAKKALATAVYNHFIRLKATNSSIKKSNILLVGPTGSGKTLLAETLANIMDVPIVIADATSLTEAGYVGEDVEHIITKLLKKCDYNVEKAQRGIIYIDEIDKISKKSENASTTREVGGEGVQQALLKLIEGTVASIPANGEHRKVPGSETIDIDTTNILFICGGAFAGIDKIVNAKSNTGGIGFNQKIKDISKEKEISSAIASVGPEELIKFGLIPEFVGRMPIVVPLAQLDTEALKRILTEPKNCLTKQYIELMELSGIKLEFENDAIDAIAELATKRKIGARGLRSIMEDTLEDVMFDAPSEDNLEMVIITKECVLNKKPPKLIYKKIAA